MSAGRSASVVQVALVALFTTALVTAQLTATKVLGFGLPVSLPVVGAELVLPGASLAYALTFLASDCYAELYGRRAAHELVVIGFAMNAVLLGLVWATILAPAAGSSAVDPAAFSEVLGASTNVVLGSLLAYLVSQNWDIYAFDRLREYTDGDALWLRNVGSTATSQAIDTVVFVGVAFSLAPALLGFGSALPASALLALGIGQYLLKLLIAVCDTPLVYAIVGYARSRSDAGGPAASAD